MGKENIQETEGAIRRRKISFKHLVFEVPEVDLCVSHLAIG